MEAAAHTPGGYDGVPQEVGKEFVAHDDNEQLNELDIARLIQSGELPSPQHVNNMWLFKLRITGTGTAYRTKLDQYVYREPDNYLNDEFLARCNGLSVIWEHPEKNKLDSKEFSDRIIGSIFIPYIQDDEVWGIAKIYDEEAAKLMIDKQLSTSPAVIFSNEILENSNVIINSDTSVLVEGKPSILDHLAICEIGVWDKGGEPSGVISNNPEVNNMSEMDKKDEEIKADGDMPEAIPAEHEAEEKKDVSLDEQILAIVKKALAEHAGGAKADEAEDPLKMPDEPQATFADEDEEKKEATDAYNKVLSIDPDNALVLNNLAYMTADSGTNANLDQALTYAERAKKRAPDSADVSDTLGFVYYKKDLNSEALRIFRQLTTDHPQNFTFRLHLAMALLKSGDRQSAKDEATKAAQSAATPDEKSKINSLMSQIG